MLLLNLMEFFQFFLGHKLHLVDATKTPRRNCGRFALVCFGFSFTMLRFWLNCQVPVEHHYNFLPGHHGQFTSVTYPRKTTRPNNPDDTPLSQWLFLEWSVQNMVGHLVMFTQQKSYLKLYTKRS